MKLIFASLLLLLCVVRPAVAHQLDEFLQAATINIETNRITIDMRLTPGVEVFRAAYIEMNPDGSGTLTETQQKAYAELVRTRLTLVVDGHPLKLATASQMFPSVEEMKAGAGDILLTYQADVPAGSKNRLLTLTNRHQSGIAAYLVNCLVPSDPAIKIVRQSRNYNQSAYTLEYAQSTGPPPSHAARAGTISLNTRRWAALIVAGVTLAAIGLWTRRRLFPIRGRD